MKNLFLILVGWLLFSAQSAHADSQEWSQCALLHDYLHLRTKANASSIHPRLREMLSPANQLLADEKTTGQMSDHDKTLATCLLRIDPKMQAEKFDHCIPSFLTFAMAYMFRQQALEIDVAKSLNVASADKKIEEMIQFVYAKPIPTPGRGLSAQWKGEWMRKCMAP